MESLGAWIPTSIHPSSTTADILDEHYHSTRRQVMRPSQETERQDLNIRFRHLITGVGGFWPRGEEWVLVVGEKFK